MKFNLSEMNRKELEKLQADIVKARTKFDILDKRTARTAAEKVLKSYGFKLSDLTEMGDTPKATRKKKTGPKSPSIPKYCNPNNRDSTWTGKGRPPAWFVAEIQAGASKESLEI